MAVAPAPAPRVPPISPITMSAADTARLTHAATLKTALQHHHAGRLAQAEALYKQVLDAAPEHPDALHLLGMVAFQTGRPALARDLVERAIGLDPREPYYRHDLGDILRDQERLDDAAARYREAIALKPDLAPAHANLAIVLHKLGRLDDAVAAYEQALAHAPKSPDLAYNAGNALRQQGKLDEAVARYREALTLEPRFPSALYNLAVTYQRQAKHAEAVDTYRRLIEIEPQFAAAHFNLATLHESLGHADAAIGGYRATLALMPDFAEAHNNLANLMQARGDAEAALAGYGRALAQKPGYADAHNNLANLLYSLGRHDDAVAAFQRALQAGETPEIKANFGRTLAALDVTRDDPAVRALLLRALTEPWARPSELATVAARALRASAAFAAPLERAAKALPAPLSAAALFGPDGMAPIASDPLFAALVTSTPVTDAALEKLLTLARAALWEVVEADGAEPAALDLFGALARQCYLNDYAFAVTADEDARVARLRGRIEAALAAGDDVAPAALALLASYQPLGALRGAAALVAHAWPAPVDAVVRQQVAEVRAEHALRDALPSLTPIDDATSRRVQAQYEEHPYPRWTRAAPPRPAAAFDAWLHSALPGVPFEPLRDDGAFDLLIAGCGTGQHALETAQRFPRARILAIDLSRASLGYAARKAQEAAAGNVEFAQADLLGIAAAGRRFDVIEAVGVLHHLADPAAGWRALLDVLRPGGFLLAGLYGERARAAITAARGVIEAEGYAATAADIRRFRAAAIGAPEGSPLRALAALRDFHSVAETRDLLFHVQEHRTTLPAIKTLLATLGVRFLGFQMPPAVVADYARRFPEDPYRTDLDRWNAYEALDPRAFAGMYEFWVQKARE